MQHRANSSDSDDAHDSQDDDEDSDFAHLTAKYYQDSSADDDVSLVVYSEQRAQLRAKENNKRKLQETRQTLNLKERDYVGVCVQDYEDEQSSWEIVQVKSIDRERGVFVGYLHEQQQNGKTFLAKLDTNKQKMTDTYDVATALAIVTLTYHGVLNQCAKTKKQLNTLAAAYNVRQLEEDDGIPAVRSKRTYEVESICSLRRNKKNSLEFEVRWKEWQGTTWEPAKSFEGGSEQMMRDYLRANDPPPFKAITLGEWVSFPPNVALPQKLCAFDPLIGHRRENTRDRDWFLDMDDFKRLSESLWLTQELLYFGLHDQVAKDSEVCVFSTEIWNTQQRHPSCWARCASDPSPLNRRIWLMPMSWDASSEQLLHANNPNRNTSGTHWTCVVMFFPPKDVADSEHPVFAMHLDSMMNPMRGRAASTAVDAFSVLLEELCGNMKVYKLPCSVPQQLNTWQCGDHVIVACRAICRPGTIEACYQEFTKHVTFSETSMVVDFSRFVSKNTVQSLRAEMMASIKILSNAAIMRSRGHDNTPRQLTTCTQMAKCIGVEAVNGDVWIHFDLPTLCSKFWATTKSIELLWKRIELL